MNTIFILTCACLIAPSTLGQDQPEGPMEWMEAAEKFAVEGNYADALTLYLRCFDAGRDNPEFAGVRVSFLLGYIKSLGSTYPPAMDALRDRREQARNQLASTVDKKTQSLALLELVALNDILGARAENVALYDKLRAENADEKLLEIIGHRIAEELTDRGEPPRKSSRAEQVIKAPEFLQPYSRPDTDPQATEQQKRWDRTKMEVARVSVDLGRSFYRSMEAWRGFGRNPAILIEGDAVEDIDAGSKGVVHVLGNVSTTIRASGQSEIIIGGDLTGTGRIETSGITRIFVAGDMAGEIRDSGSSVIIVERDLTGIIRTGTPSTDIQVRGDFKGKIEPLSVASLLSLTVEGTMLSSAIQEVAGSHWTEFKASIAKSDLPVGLYPKLREATNTQWVVHATLP